jgi:hypothetical protein
MFIKFFTTGDNGPHFNESNQEVEKNVSLSIIAVINYKRKSISALAKPIDS